MRVLLFGSYPPPYGGLQVHVVALRRFLLDRGIPCAFINLDRHREENHDDIYYPVSGLAVLWLLLRLRYDLVHVHVGGEFAKRHLLLGLVCGLLPWAKTVFTLHSGGYPSSSAGRSMSPSSVGAFVLRRFDRVVAVNQEGVDFFLRIGIAAPKIKLIAPYAFSPAAIEPILAADRGELLGDELDRFIDRHDPTLLTVGLLESHYNLALQVQALGEIREAFPGAGLVIVGSGSLAAELEELIAARPYADHILLRGDVSHSATLRTIADADLLLRTTSYDGDAISIREALHFGTPVLATDNGMRPDGVHLIDHLDGKNVAAGVELVLSSPGASHAVTFDDGNLRELLSVFEELRP